MDSLTKLINSNKVKYIIRDDKHINLNYAMFRQGTELLYGDIIVKGGDYTPKEVVGNDLAEVVIFGTIDGYSSTKIIEVASNRWVMHRLVSIWQMWKIKRRGTGADIAANQNRIKAGNGS